MARLVTNFKKSFGPGGKSSNSGLTVAVFGGHGFLGRYLLNDLGKNFSVDLLCHIFYPM